MSALEPSVTMTTEARNAEMRQEALPEIDPWAPVPFDDLPAPLVRALEEKDWPAVRAGLADIMDSITTDGVYGRALLQFVRKIPIGVDPIFDRYRAAAAIDHGDWDDLRRCLAASPSHPHELTALQEIFLAPIGRVRIPAADRPEDVFLFEAYEFDLERRMGSFRQWARNSAVFDASPRLGREDVAIGRHLRYRALHGAVMNAIAELHAGRLPVAAALARDGQHLGDEGEPLRSWAADIAQLVPLAMGSSGRVDLRLPINAARSTGMSPYGLLQWALYLMPGLVMLDDDRVRWTTRLAEHIATKIGSPRLQLETASWRVASEIGSLTPEMRSEVAGLAMNARRAGPGLRALPEFLEGRVSRRPSALARAERLARGAGNVWLQVSALTWMLALDPTPLAARSLLRLLKVSGWRRPALVPPNIAADAALGLMSVGARAAEVVELALVAGRANVTLEVAGRVLDDQASSELAQLAAVDALAQLHTTRARELLRRVTDRSAAVTEAVAKALATRGPEPVLTEREVEVVELAARGLTNAEIGARLVLSPHTVARHLANSRAKLGASNRTEAAIRLSAVRADERNERA
jgi:DNA-binding CsgD family transcriptional regulator